MHVAALSYFYDHLLYNFMYWCLLFTFNRLDRICSTPVKKLAQLSPILADQVQKAHTHCPLRRHPDGFAGDCTAGDDVFETGNARNKAGVCREEIRRGVSPTRRPDSRREVYDVNECDSRTT